MQVHEKCTRYIYNIYYMYVYIYIYTCMHSCRSSNFRSVQWNLQDWTRGHTHAYTHIHTHVHAHTHIYTNIPGLGSSKHLLVRFCVQDPVATCPSAAATRLGCCQNCVFCARINVIWEFGMCIHIWLSFVTSLHTHMDAYTYGCDHGNDMKSTSRMSVFGYMILGKHT